MKKSTLFLAVLIFIVVGLVKLASGEIKRASQNQILRHVVLLDLNDQASDSIVQNMEEDLQELKENIFQIRDLEFGATIQNDSEYSHCMLLTFDDAESLSEYEAHPKHLEFASTYGKYVVKKMEVDYWR